MSWSSAQDFLQLHINLSLTLTQLLQWDDGDVHVVFEFQSAVQELLNLLLVCLVENEKQSGSHVLNDLVLEFQSELQEKGIFERGKRGAEHFEAHSRTQRKLLLSVSKDQHQVVVSLKQALAGRLRLTVVELVLGVSFAQIIELQKGLVFQVVIFPENNRHLEILRCFLEPLGKAPLLENVGLFPDFLQNKVPDLLVTEYAGEALKLVLNLVEKNGGLLGGYLAAERRGVADDEGESVAQAELVIVFCSQLIQ